MENFFVLVSDGKKLPELYHLGFNGSHFQLFLSKGVYVDLLARMGNAYHLGEDFIPPALESEHFGFGESAHLSRTFSEGVCIEIPAVFDSKDDTGPRSAAKTLSIVLMGLSLLLYESAKRVDVVEGGESQLFVLDTVVGEQGTMHSGSFGISVSHTARRYLEDLGEDIRFPEAVRAMRHHANTVFPGSESGFPLSFFSVQLRTKGVIGMSTIGDCACLGTAPEDFQETDGCYLSSHNVDGIFQQFNLLVGVAYIWQMVRDGVHTQPHV